VKGEGGGRGAKGTDGREDQQLSDRDAIRAQDIGANVEELDELVNTHLLKRQRARSRVVLGPKRRYPRGDQPARSGPLSPAEQPLPNVPGCLSPHELAPCRRSRQLWSSSWVSRSISTVGQIHHAATALRHNLRHVRDCDQQIRHFVESKPLHRQGTVVPGGPLLGNARHQHARGALACRHMHRIFSQEAACSTERTHRTSCTPAIPRPFGTYRRAPLCKTEPRAPVCKWKSREVQPCSNKGWR